MTYELELEDYEYVQLLMLCKDNEGIDYTELLTLQTTDNLFNKEQ